MAAMRVLVLGATGMLGHKLCYLYRDRYDVWCAARGNYDTCSPYGIYRPDRFLSGLDASDFPTFHRAIDVARPDVIINCVGIVKQAPQANSPVDVIEVNALLPHRIASVCQNTGSRLIHISTDCVFSGRRGMYTENDIPDAEDLYGRSKALGEVTGAGCVTLRTSIIGRELKRAYGLVEWFLSNAGGSVSGYSRAVFSGLTCHVLADVIASIIDDYPGLSGLYQVSSDPISKYDLLMLLRDSYGIEVDIRPSSDVKVDRSLDSRRFREATGFRPPSWEEMVRGLASDPSPYGSWRKMV